MDRPVTDKPQFYFINSTFPISEDSNVEFKQLSGLSVTPLIDNVLKYVCGFLNASGGKLFYGINDDGVVEGVLLSQEGTLQVKQMLETAIEKQFSCSPVKYVFYNVVDENYNTVDNRFVLEIDVKKGRPDEIYAVNNNVFVKANGVIYDLDDTEIKNYTRNKIKKYYKSL